jgi:hypothetical protein
MTDTKDQNEEKKEEGGKEEEHERDDILGQLSEKEGQELPRKKEPAVEPPKEEIKPSKADSESEDSEDFGSLIEKKITDHPESDAGDLGPVEEMSAGQRIVGIFTSPQKVFQYLRVKPEFWIPILLAIIVGVAVSYLVYDIALSDAVANYEKMDMPDQQRDTILDSIESRRTGAWRYTSIFVFPIIGVFVIFGAVALAYWFVGNVVLGGKAKYKQVFSAYAYSYLILTIVGSIVKVPLILSNQTLKVQTSLALFMSQEASNTALYRFLDAFDIFTIWMLVVFAIGYAAIYRFSQVKAFMGVFVTWLLYVLVFGVALGSFFSKFTGR